MVLLKKPLPMLDGEVGPAPEQEELCESYVRSQLSGGRRGRGSVWLRRGSGLYRVSWCGVTGAWDWTRAALCGCQSDKCGVSLDPVY